MEIQPLLSDGCRGENKRAERRVKSLAHTIYTGDCIIADLGIVVTYCKMAAHHNSVLTRKCFINIDGKGNRIGHRFDHGSLESFARQVKYMRVFIQHSL